MVPVDEAGTRHRHIAMVRDADIEEEIGRRNDGPPHERKRDFRETATVFSECEPAHGAEF